LPGRRLLNKLYTEAEDRSLTLVIIAALKDPALFLRDGEDLFVKKTKQVVIMGGVEPWEETGDEIELKPDKAHNNMFDINASRFFYKRCQELGVPLVVVSRWTAYAAKVPRSCYDDLAALGSPIGCRLRNAQRSSIEDLWSRACAPSKSPGRRGLPDRCDRSWFLKTFCNGADDRSRSGEDTIWDLVTSFMQYDTIALLASFTKFRDDFFEPTVVRGKHGVRHLVIGQSEQQHGIKNQLAIAEYMRTGFSEGLALNHQYKLSLVLFLQPRWDNRADDLLAIVMLRALYETGMVDCLGIVVGRVATETSGRNVKKTNSSYSTDSTAETAQELMDTLRSVGLPHVPVLFAQANQSDQSAAAHLSNLYAQAPPAGVALVIDAALTEVYEFASKHTKAFREKTQSVILVGGGEYVEEDEDEEEIVPDRSAQNYRLDWEAAQNFFKKAQRNLVPLVILSRHFSKSCPLPRKLFDVLGSHGGPVGKILYEVQVSSANMLWEAACSTSRSSTRKDLPVKCDKAWFLRRYCDMEASQLPKGTKDIWPCIKHFNFFAVFAVLAAVPPIFAHVGSCALADVRGVEHMLVGVDANHSGVRSLEKLKRLLFQSLFLGAQINTSEFEKAETPPIPVTKTDDWTFDPTLESLDWIMETPSSNMDSAGAAYRAFAHTATVKKQATFAPASSSSMLMRTATSVW